MGDTRRVLAEREIAPAPVYYADKRSLEAAESLHHHERNLRLEYTPKEWGAMLAAMLRGARVPYGISDRTVYLDLSDIDPVCGMHPTRLRVEEVHYPTLPETTIHIHYRSLRIEMSHAEFREFAEAIAEARGFMEALEALEALDDRG